MINYLSILLSHALIAWVCWRLLTRDDLDRDGPPPVAQAPAPRVGAAARRAARREAGQNGAAGDGAARNGVGTGNA